MEDSHAYSEGDWIVHSHYGVGKIQGVEVKSISGEDSSYFRIITNNSTFWVPVDQMDSAVLRPLSTPEGIQEAIDVLHRPAVEMSSNTKIRQSRIQSVRLDNSPTAIARLIRDLRAREREKGVLYSSERSAFQTLRERLIQEWAIVMEADVDDISAELDGLLDITPIPAVDEGK